MTLSANLSEMSHGEARALLARGAPVFLAINPVEYHGPHLSLHNDALISAGVAAEMHRALTKTHPDWRFVTAGELEIGVDPTRGPGTRHTAYPVACELIREACRALIELGAQKVVLLTFHGAPMHNLAIETGVEILARAGVRVVAPFNLLARYLLEADGSAYAQAYEHIEDLAERREMMRDLFQDFHAGFAETSLTLHYAPESVSPSYRDVPPCPPIEPLSAWLNASRAARVMGAATLASELKLAAYGTGWQMLNPFPGYTGRPHRATAHAGAVFAAEIVRQAVACTEAVFEGREQSPQPVMQWLPALSMNGRLVATLQHS